MEVQQSSLLLIVVDQPGNTPLRVHDALDGLLSACWAGGSVFNKRRRRSWALKTMDTQVGATAVIEPKRKHSGTPTRTPEMAPKRRSHSRCRRRPP